MLLTELKKDMIRLIFLSGEIGKYSQMLSCFHKAIEIIENNSKLRENE